MSLIKCRECGALVSTKAKRCQRCGTAPSTPGMALKTLTWIVVVPACALLVLSLIGDYRKGKESARKRADAQIIESGLRDAMSPEEYAAYTAKIRIEEFVAAKAEAADKALKAERLTAIASAERDVKKLLRDPSSARFGQKEMFTNVDARLGMTICGYVNAKNAFGGYIGEQGYIVIDRAARLGDGSDAFASSWNRLCK